MLRITVATLLSVAMASGEGLSLVQTYLGQGSRPLITLQKGFEDAAVVEGLLQQFLALERDISVALEVNGPRLYTQANRADLSKCQEFRGLLDSQLRQLRSSGGSGSGSGSPASAGRNAHPQLWTRPQTRAGELSLKALRQFNSSLRKRLYPPQGQLAFLISSDRTLCIQGSTHYMKRVLSSLRASPLQQAFDPRRSFLDMGECRYRGYHSQSAAGRLLCYPQSSTWLKTSRRAASASDLDTEMMQVGMQKEGKTAREVQRAMAQACQSL